MAWKLTIAGVDRSAEVFRPAGVSIRPSLNERTTAAFSLIAGATVPDLLDTVYIYAQDGVTKLFGGLVYSKSVSGIGQASFVSVECVDWSVYGDWHYLTLTLVDEAEPSPARSLKYILEQLVVPLAAHGVTLAAGQADGPDIDAFDWTLVRVSDALRELSTKTGYEVTWSPEKVLQMVAPGSASTPAAIDDASLNALDLSWSETMDGYATRVFVLCGPDGSAETWQEWTGNGTTDQWTTDMRSTTPYPTVVEESVTTGGVTTVNRRTVSSGTSYPIESSSESPAAVNITSASIAVQTEVTCAAAHGVDSGAWVTIAGNSKIANGSYQVLSIDGTTKFTIDFTVSGAVGTGGTSRYRQTTVTTTRVHDFAIGDTVVFVSHDAVPTLNGSRTVETVPSDTTFTISQLVTTAGTKVGSVKESAAEYAWDNASHTLAVDTRAEGIPGADTVLRLEYTGRFPFTVSATAGVSPTIDYRTTAPDVVTVAAGQEIADGLLAAMYQIPTEITWTSLVHGWAPGQVGLVESAIRMAGRYVVVTSVDMALVSDAFWVYTMKGQGIDMFTSAVSPTSSPRWALNYFRQLGSGTSSATIGGVAGLTTNTTALTSPYPLGGSRTSSIPMAASPAYTAVLDWLPYVAGASFSARVRVSLWARGAGVSVTARLRNTTDGTTAGTSSAVTATTATETTFSVAIVAGKTYRLEVISGTASESAYAIGILESL